MLKVFHTAAGYRAHRCELSFHRSPECHPKFSSSCVPSWPVLRFFSSMLHYYCSRSELLCNIHRVSRTVTEATCKRARFHKREISGNTRKATTHETPAVMMSSAHESRSWLFISLMKSVSIRPHLRLYLSPFSFFFWTSLPAEKVAVSVFTGAIFWWTIVWRGVDTTAPMWLGSGRRSVTSAWQTGTRNRRPGRHRTL